MGIFFTAHQPVVPEINSAIRIALLVDPTAVPNVEQEAAQRTTELIRATSQQFNPLRFCAALLIAGTLFWGGVWTAQHNLPDISRDMMNCFVGFSGIVIGLIVGEAQKLSPA